MIKSVIKSNQKYGFFHDLWNYVDRQRLFWDNLLNAMMSTKSHVSCHENPICLILSIGPLLNNCQKFLQHRESERLKVGLWNAWKHLWSDNHQSVAMQPVPESRNLLIFLWALANFDITSLQTHITWVKLQEHKISKENTFTLILSSFVEIWFKIFCWRERR